MRATMLMPSVALAALALAGCHRTSPYVGSWAGESKPVTQPQGFAAVMTSMAASPLMGPATLALRPDGTGYMKFGQVPEGAIKWQADGRKITIQATDPQKPDGKAPAAKEPATNTIDLNNVVGTLAEDGKSLTVDLGPARMEMKKVANDS